MNRNLVLLLAWVAAFPAAAQGRRELIRDARQLINRALDANDETDSDCQMALEHRLERLLKALRPAQNSDRALRRAIDLAQTIRDSAENDCPGEITRSTMRPLNRAIRKLNGALDPDNYDGEDGDYSEAPPPAPQPQPQFQAPPPPPPPVMASAPTLDVTGVSASPDQNQGMAVARINVSGLGVRGMAGHNVVFSVSVRALRGPWMEPVSLNPVFCNDDSCGWDTPVTFTYSEDALRAGNYDNGQFVAQVSAVDSDSNNRIGTRELQFTYPFAAYAPAEYVQPVEPPPAVISVEYEAPITEPVPIAVEWAPPPMLVETPPSQPGPDWYWVGGFWTWQGEWVWVNGHWRQPPYAGYSWCEPYYENRGGWVVFIPGHWNAPGVRFIPPPMSANIVRVQPRPGVMAGPRPMGPSGVFVPPPPGSRPGIIVSAPVGTPPSVVVSAPPVVRPGMRVQGVVSANLNANSTMTVVAPAGVTANGKPVQTTVPAAPHLAAALPAVVRVTAPPPPSAKPVTAFVPGRPMAELPKAQPARVAPTTAAARVETAATQHRAMPMNQVAPPPPRAIMPGKPLPHQQPMPERH